VQILAAIASTHDSCSEVLTATGYLTEAGILRSVFGLKILCVPGQPDLAISLETALELIGTMSCSSANRIGRDETF